MGEHTYTKILSRIVAIVTLIFTIGFGLLSLLGASLAKALNSSIDHSAESRLVLLVCLALVVCSIITGLGSFWLTHKSWRLFYIGFCFLIGVGFIAGFFASYGALGTKNELFILSIGAVYLLLSFLAKQNK